MDRQDSAYPFCFGEITDILYIFSSKYKSVEISDMYCDFEEKKGVLLLRLIKHNIKCEKNAVPKCRLFTEDRKCGAAETKKYTV